MKPLQHQIGPLEVVEVPGKPGGLTVVLFHGYGAGAYDLVPLHEIAAAPAGTRWIFPDGIEDAANGMGRAWFPINEEALQNAMIRGTHVDFSQQEPQGL